MSQTKSPKTQVALGRLTEIIENLARSGQRRLPTVKRLAVSIGASYVTVSKTLQILRAKKMITAGRRHGIWIARSMPGMTGAGDDALSVVPEFKWERIKKQILDDLLNGSYKPGAMLPSCKELMERYGVCFVVLKRALEALEHEGRLVSYKKGYRPYQAARRNVKSLLMFIVEGDDPKQFVELNSRALEFWRALEWECQRLAIDLEIYTIHDVLGTGTRDLERQKRFRSQTRTRIIAGYFVWVLSAAVDELNLLQAVLSKTAGNVSLFDETVRPEVVAGMTNNRRFKLFTSADGVAAGKIVGDYLLALGHRRIAYLSFAREVEWSRNRVAGIAKACAVAGLADAVSEFAVDIDERITPLWRYTPGSQPFTEIQPLLVKARRVIEPLAETADRSFYDHAVPFLFRSLIGPAMMPLLEEAIRERSITAWVAANDEVGFVCQKFLHEKGIGVPKSMSVIGFDDTARSITAGLTSYNFNISAIALAMLDHVLGGRMTRTGRGGAPIQIPGVIVERSSTARASLNKT